MALKPCRACTHSVDTSAQFCPQCGATRPAHKLSAQVFGQLILALEIVVGVSLLYVAMDKIWEEMAPVIKSQLQKGTSEKSP